MVLIKGVNDKQYAISRNQKFYGFELDGISYYYFNGEYYADDMTIRVVISSEEYRYALMSRLIKEA